MSPLKIIALLRLHTRPDPFADMPWQQATAPAMVEAYGDFEQQGLLAEGVNFNSVYHGTSARPFLSANGQELVKRLCEVEP